MIAKLVSKFLQSPEGQARIRDMEQLRQSRDQSVNSRRTGFTDLNTRPDEEALKRIRAQLMGKL